MLHALSSRFVLSPHQLFHNYTLIGCCIVQRRFPCSDTFMPPSHSTSTDQRAADGPSLAASVFNAGYLGPSFHEGSHPSQLNSHLQDMTGGRRLTNPAALSEGHPRQRLMGDGERSGNGTSRGCRGWACLSRREPFCLSAGSCCFCIYDDWDAEGVVGMVVDEEAPGSLLVRYDLFDKGRSWEPRGKGILTRHAHQARTVGSSEGMLVVERRGLPEPGGHGFSQGTLRRDWVNDSEGLINQTMALGEPRQVGHEGWWSGREGPDGGNGEESDGAKETCGVGLEEDPFEAADPIDVGYEYIDEVKGEGQGCHRDLCCKGVSICNFTGRGRDDVRGHKGAERGDVSCGGSDRRGQEGLGVSGAGETFNPLNSERSPLPPIPAQPTDVPGMGLTRRSSKQPDGVRRNHSSQIGESDDALLVSEANQDAIMGGHGGESKEDKGMRGRTTPEPSAQANVRGLDEPSAFDRVYRGHRNKERGPGNPAPITLSNHDKYNVYSRFGLGGHVLALRLIRLPMYRWVHTLLCLIPALCAALTLLIGSLALYHLITYTWTIQGLQLSPSSLTPYTLARSSQSTVECLILLAIALLQSPLLLIHTFAACMCNVSLVTQSTYLLLTQTLITSLACLYPILYHHAFVDHQTAFAFLSPQVFLFLLVSTSLGCTTLTTVLVRKARQDYRDIGPIATTTVTSSPSLHHDK